MKTNDMLAFIKKLKKRRASGKVESAEKRRRFRNLLKRIQCENDGRQVTLKKSRSSEHIGRDTDELLPTHGVAAVDVYPVKDSALK